MCARITLRRSQLLFDFAVKARAAFGRVEPRFNITPGQRVPVVRMSAGNAPMLSDVEWGLIPHWTKGKPWKKPFNARSDKVMISGMYKDAFDRRRCLVPVDGYYEWSGEKAPRQPYFVRFKDDRAFALAGLWERWRPDAGSEPVDTFTVITTDPNPMVAEFHHRMPVILNASDYGRWLDRSVGGAGVVELLVPFQSDEMEGYKVSTALNDIGRDDPSLIEPI